MLDADPFPFDAVAAFAEDAQQAIGNAVIEQVEIVNVQHAAMRLRQQARLKHWLPLLH